MAKIQHKSLDDMFAYSSPMGSRLSSLTNTLSGFNIATTGVPAVAPNTDRLGYVFFTRPQLNLSRRNCMRQNEFYNLLRSNQGSLQTFIRSTLDPRLYTIPEETANSPMVMNTSGFIPLLTNTIRSLSGWPDLVAPTYTTQEGLRGETLTMVDGPLEYYREYDLDATFYNMQEDPITHLFHTWLLYATYVNGGELHPYIDKIIENEIDYNTRIYRIVTDKYDRYVSKIAMTGASIPISLPTGTFANYDRDRVTNTELKDISIRFRCNGAIYNHPRSYVTFNQVTKIFNTKFAEFIRGGSRVNFDSQASLDRLDLGGSFLDVNKRNGTDFVKLYPDDMEAFNHLAFPYINVYTSELMWIIDLSDPKVKIVLDKVQGDPIRSTPKVLRT